ncbi:MAG: universal stress protein [Proteobacteria bacterium]|nr:universal stress protein [Pseudomonadota bacterium]
MTGGSRLASDGTVDASGALEPALALADRLGAELYMVLAQELQRFPRTMGDIDDERRATDQRSTFVVASAQQHAQEANVRFRPHVIVGRTVDRVIQCVSDNKINLMIATLKGLSTSPHCLSAIRPSG